MKRFFQSLLGFVLYSDPEYYQDWVYGDYEDVYLTRGNLRYSPSRDRVQLLDVDGWCDGMSGDEAEARYGVPAAKQEAAQMKILAAGRRLLR